MDGWAWLTSFLTASLILSPSGECTRGKVLAPCSYALAVQAGVIMYSLTAEEGKDWPGPGNKVGRLGLLALEVIILPPTLPLFQFGKFIPPIARILFLLVACLHRDWRSL
ncbi:hypothetical protein DFH27DRAFT_567089 [Peziza echinospora]|nr:hypothetical protein DFH27DRAFT_567089 [Peziza echinospora]